MDQILSFTFENYSIRGSLVRLNESWLKVLETSLLDKTEYILKDSLGQFVVAGLLLSSTIKLEGSLLVQIIGNGPVSMLLVEVFVQSQKDNISFRAMAKSDSELLSKLEKFELIELVKGSNLSLIIDPKEGSQAYQSIVPVESNSIASIFESYMLQSEQIDTRLFLFSSDKDVFGILLQVIPEETKSSLSIAASDITREVLSNLTFDESLIKASIISHSSSNDILRAVFSNYDIRVFETRNISFSCRCRREKIASVLVSLGKEEAHNILQEEGTISVSCEFCGQLYKFDSIDVASLFSSSSALGINKWKN